MTAPSRCSTNKQMFPEGAVIKINVYYTYNIPPLSSFIYPKNFFSLKRRKEILYIKLILRAPLKFKLYFIYTSPRDILYV